MSKLETIDNKHTSYGGLWWHPEYNSFSSQALSLTELKKFKGAVRLIVRKNHYFNNGQNGRPNYQFCFADAKTENPYLLEVKNNESTKTTMLSVLAMVKDEVEKLRCYSENEDYYDGYDECRQDIIKYIDEMVEEIEE